MFSVFLRSASLRSLSQAQQKQGQCLALLYNVRLSSSVTTTKPTSPVPSPSTSTSVIPEGASSTATLISTWDKANALFYGPERDYKNFPHPVQPEFAGKVRLKFIPDEWFTFFYPKTGVLGPYIFTWGLVAYLLSKEIWVIDHNFSEVFMFWGAMIILHKLIGKTIAHELSNGLKEGEDYQYNIPLANARKIYNARIEHCDQEIYRLGAQQYINESKRENVDLQLEAVYRGRLAQVYSDIKRRLDYVLEKETSEKKMEQDHMVDWIVSNVRKGITPEQEKNSISKCIQDLQSLAKQHGPVIG